MHSFESYFERWNELSISIKTTVSNLKRYSMYTKIRQKHGQCFFNLFVNTNWAKPMRMNKSFSNDTYQRKKHVRMNWFSGMNQTFQHYETVLFRINWFCGMNLNFQNYETSLFRTNRFCGMNQTFQRYIWFCGMNESF